MTKICRQDEVDSIRTEGLDHAYQNKNMQTLREKQN
jgi:hypothetical protein